MPKPLNYVHTYYDIQVVDSEIREMKGFIDQVPDSWYRPNQLSYEDKDRDIYIEKYRSCGILFSLDDGRGTTFPPFISSTIFFVTLKVLILL